MIIRAGAKVFAYSRLVGKECLRVKRPPGYRWSTSQAIQRQWSTPLAQNLAEVVATTGPISIAAYMRQCLTSPDGGYYTTQTEGKDQFGRKGDFITSPEISQIFGELLGIWLVAEWMSQGKIRNGVEIIEVGPGRGTLMDDMLRTIGNFKPLASSIESVYLVEASPALREKQKHLLCGDAPFSEIDVGFRNASKTPYIFAHEFFDALPIHAFRSVAPKPDEGSQTLETPTGRLPLSKPSPASKTLQWRELVVTPAPPTSSPTTPASTTITSTSPPPPDFQLSLSKASTPPSLYLPTLSPRYAALLPTPGSIIEISPESHSYAAEFALRIGGSPPNIPTKSKKSYANNQQPSPATPKPRPSGAALILDYGPASTIPTSSLRGIRAHKPVSPFQTPGLVDLSADVDFAALAEAALQASPGVEVHGPVEQGAWLESMGIRQRGEMLCKRLEEGGGEGVEEAKGRVRGAIERLVERGGGAMGKVYKVLAIVPERGGKKLVGFGGSVD